MPWPWNLEGQTLSRAFNGTAFDRKEPYPKILVLLASLGLVIVQCALFDQSRHIKMSTNHRSNTQTSCDLNTLHVFLRLAPNACFPALHADFVFSFDL